MNQANSESFKLAAVILSGGKGERLKGLDKGLVDFEGEPVIAKVLHQVEQCADAIVISCNRNQEQYQKFGHQLIVDELSGFQGPLAGIHQALQNFQTSYTHLLVLPCDTPKLTLSPLQRLCSAAQDNPDAICFLKTEDRPQFLHAIIPTQLLDNLTDWLVGGERAVYKWYRQHKIYEVDATDCADQLQNFNSPEAFR